MHSTHRKPKENSERLKKSRDRAKVHSSSEHPPGCSSLHAPLFVSSGNSLDSCYPAYSLPLLLFVLFYASPLSFCLSLSIPLQNYRTGIVYGRIRYYSVWILLRYKVVAHPLEQVPRLSARSFRFEVVRRAEFLQRLLLRR